TAFTWLPAVQNTLRQGAVPQPSYPPNIGTGIHSESSKEVPLPVIKLRLPSFTEFLRIKTQVFVAFATPATAEALSKFVPFSSSNIPPTWSTTVESSTASEPVPTR